MDEKELLKKEEKTVMMRVHAVCTAESKPMTITQILKDFHMIGDDIVPSRYGYRSHREMFLKWPEYLIPVDDHRFTCANQADTCKLRKLVVEQFQKGSYGTTLGNERQDEIFKALGNLRRRPAVKAMLANISQQPSIFSQSQCESVALYGVHLLGNMNWKDRPDIGQNGATSIRKVMKKLSLRGEVGSSSETTSESSTLVKFLALFNELLPCKAGSVDLERLLRLYKKLYKKDLIEDGPTLGTDHSGRFIQLPGIRNLFTVVKDPATDAYRVTRRKAVGPDGKELKAVCNGNECASRVRVGQSRRYLFDGLRAKIGEYSRGSESFLTRVRVDGVKLDKDVPLENKRFHYDSSVVGGCASRTSSVRYVERSARRLQPSTMFVAQIREMLMKEKAKEMLKTSTGGNDGTLKTSADTKPDTEVIEDETLKVSANAKSDREKNAYGTLKTSEDAKPDIEVMKQKIEGTLKSSASMKPDTELMKEKTRETLKVSADVKPETELMKEKTDGLLNASLAVKPNAEVVKERDEVTSKASTSAKPNTDVMKEMAEATLEASPGAKPGAKVLTTGGAQRWKGASHSGNPEFWKRVAICREESGKRNK